jgi:hypothetical protein
MTVGPLGVHGRPWSSCHPDSQTFDLHLGDTNGSDDSEKRKQQAKVKDE